MVRVHILAVVLAVIYPVVMFYIMDSMWSSLWINFDAFMNWNLYLVITSESFNVFFILVFCFTIKHIKTTTALVLSIIGIILTGLMFFFCLAPLAGVGPFFDIAPIIICFTPVLLAFSIVNLVQANMVKNKHHLRINQKTVDEIV